MTVNLFGPYGVGVNEVTSRPTRPTNDGATDTWFGPCSSDTARDGTKVMHYWLNDVMAQIRRAVRGMGITENVADDDMLLKALQKADRTIDNVGTGVGVYKGINGTNGHHELYKVKAGSGIGVALVDNDIVITNSGIGEGSAGLENIGDGIAIIKELVGGIYKLRSVEGVGGIVVTASVDGNKVKIDGSGLGGGIRIEKRQRWELGSNVSVAAATSFATAWSASYTPVTAANKIALQAQINAYVNGTNTDMPFTFKLDYREAGGSWTTAKTYKIGVNAYNNTGGESMVDNHAYLAAIVEADVTVPSGAPGLEFRLQVSGDRGGLVLAATSFLATEMAGA